MVVVYNCYGGTHSSILASAIHLGMLPQDRIPTKQEILDLNYFNKLTYKDMGRLLLQGVDSDGNRIYTVGRGTSRALVPALESMAYELRNNFNIKDSFAFINTSPVVPAAMTLGGFFSRGLKINFIGVPLLAIGAQQCYEETVQLVARTKQVCKERGPSADILDIDKKGRLSVKN